jgi:hypothetical protein
MPQEPTKICFKCKQVKSTTEFYVRPKANKRGLHSWCKDCCCADTRKWSADNKEMMREYNLRRDYGITIDQYNELLAEQGGACAICLTKEHNGVGKFFHVDHCHETKVIRGLLCGRCNVMIGMAHDNADRLMAAANYLQKNYEDERDHTYRRLQTAVMKNGRDRVPVGLTHRTKFTKNYQPPLPLEDEIS